MARKILVPFRSHDRIEEIVPYVEKVAQPGMKVIFLIRYPADEFEWLRDHWVTTESPRKMMLAARRVEQKYSWDEQMRLAKERVVPARQALERRGVEVAVDLFAGGLGKAVGSYRDNGDVHLILIPARSGLWMRRALKVTRWLLRRPSLSPVLLIQLNYSA